MRNAKAKALVRSEYDELSAEYDRRWRKYVDRTISATLRRVAVSPDESILDVGCGTGALLARVVARRLMGVDLSLAMLALARWRAGPIVVAGDAEQLPFRDGSFDVAVSTSSLHFWPSPPRSLAEMRRVLRPGGRLVVTDWCDDYLACRVFHRFLRGDSRVYGSEEFERLLAEAGFSAMRVDRYRISWLWGIMTVSATRG